MNTIEYFKNLGYLLIEQSAGAILFGFIVLIVLATLAFIVVYFFVVIAYVIIALVVSSPFLLIGWILTKKLTDSSL